MASLRKRGRVWYYRFTDADGVKHERKGCPDRRETERMASGSEADAGMVRAGLADPKALGFRNHEARPLSAHLSDWRAGMLAAGKTPGHVGQFITRASRVVALAGGAALADIDPEARTADARTRAEKLLADAMKGARLSDVTPEKVQA